MKIGINASCLEGRRFGVGRYLLNLLRVWAQDFPQHKYHLYFRRSIPNDEALNRECFAKTLVKCPSFLDKGPIWEHLFLSQRVSRDGHINLFFSPSYTLPLVIIGKKGSCRFLIYPMLLTQSGIRWVNGGIINWRPCLPSARQI